MLTIGICDDKQEARFALRAALERALEAEALTGRLLEFSSGEGLLGWLDRHRGELDLVFLDLEMGDLDGMETARRLRAEHGPLLKLVFVTGFSDRVFEGYQVEAIGYLLKPARPEQLADILRRTTAALDRQAADVFLCRRGEITYRIPKDQILYFLSDRRQVTCVTAQQRYTFYGKLDAVAQAVGPGFVRIHQRYLVRAGAVERVAAEEVFLGEAVLPISRSCQQAALTALTRATLEG